MRTSRALSLVAAAAAAVLVTGCSGGSSSPVASRHTSSSTPKQTATRTRPAAPALPALPAGWVRAGDHARRMQVGVPHSWLRLDLSGSGLAARVKAAKRAHPGLASRIDDVSHGSGGAFVAFDPSSTGQVLLIEKSLGGVDFPNLETFYQSFLAPQLKGSIHVTSHRTTRLANHPALHILADFQESGLVVHETIDVLIVNGTLYDLTFTGNSSTIKRMEATASLR
ncbi:MAG: hypothetical protein ACJ735_10990 [Actinomycetes bacterium]